MQRARIWQRWLVVCDLVTQGGLVSLYTTVAFDLPCEILYFQRAMTGSSSSVIPSSAGLRT
jgi:hypothetical protein